MLLLRFNSDPDTDPYLLTLFTLLDPLPDPPKINQNYLGSVHLSSAVSTSVGP